VGSPREGHAASVLDNTPTAVLLPGQIALPGAQRLELQPGRALRRVA